MQVGLVHLAAVLPLSVCECCSDGLMGARKGKSIKVRETGSKRPRLPLIAMPDQEGLNAQGIFQPFCRTNGMASPQTQHEYLGMLML